jgi:probable HAF family extracellular repeat protein
MVNARHIRFISRVARISALVLPLAGLHATASAHQADQNQENRPSCDSDGGPQRPPRYELIDLRIPGIASRPVAINNRGQIAGNRVVSRTGPGFGFLWDRGQIHDISPVGGRNSQALKLNDHGEVVGSVEVSEFVNAGLLYSHGQSESLLPLEVTSGINNHGVIVGEQQVPPPTEHTSQDFRLGFIYDHGTLTRLPGFNGPVTGVRGINDRGEITGIATRVGFDDVHAYLYRRGRTIDLGTLGGPTSNSVEINSRGDIAGYSELPDSTPLLQIYHVFLYRKGHMTDLGVVGSDTSSAALDMNDSDEVVGIGITGPDTLAIVYTHGRMRRLQDLIDPSSVLASHVRLTEATGINNDGWISATGVDSELGGDTHAYLLKPIHSRH